MFALFPTGLDEEQARRQITQEDDETSLVHQFHELRMREMQLRITEQFLTESRKAKARLSLSVLLFFYVARLCWGCVTLLLHGSADGGAPSKYSLYGLLRFSEYTEKLYRGMAVCAILASVWFLLELVHYLGKEFKNSWDQYERCHEEYVEQTGKANKIKITK
ncbi:hypothetical protein ADEAN_000438400 [Angomonas deanei]|uniref:Uncharacterized protein n=1 Tax=Angomonas deanei TaxID=59799 RepID=A0A7G2CAT6_9TRYP|nr:hypothetical protein ADEAN_000438400 [Angomonas deanei]